MNAVEVYSLHDKNTKKSTYYSSYFSAYMRQKSQLTRGREAGPRTRYMVVAVAFPKSSLSRMLQEAPEYNYQPVHVWGSIVDIYLKTPYFIWYARILFRYRSQVSYGEAY